MNWALLACLFGLMVPLSRSWRVIISTGSSHARVRVGWTLAAKSGSDTGTDNVGSEPRKKRPSWQSGYTDEDLKLKKGLFTVSVPSNININLTENEKKMIARKEEVEAAAREQAESREGDPTAGMSDADILKAEMQAMLERMRSND